MKVIAAGGLLYYVLTTKVDETAKQVLRRLFIESPAMLGLAIAAMSAQLWIGAQRVRMLLRPQGVQLGYFTSLRLTYLGAFFDTFMITSVGGDAVKAIYLAREAPEGRRVEAVSVLVLDRLMGLLGLLALTLLVAAWQYRALSADAQAAAYLKWLVIVPTLLLAGTGMLLSKTVYASRPMQALLRLLPLGKFVARAYGSLQQFRDRPLTLLAAWGMSLVVHCFGVSCGFVLVYGMGQEPALGKYAVSWLISNFICSFAPFGGIGFGQLVFEEVFKTIAGVDHGWVLATAVQASFILAKAPGLLAWLISREHIPSK